MLIASGKSNIDEEFRNNLINATSVDEFIDLINKKESYNGTYFYTNKDASSFESYISKIADYFR